MEITLFGLERTGDCYFSHPRLSSLLVSGYNALHAFELPVATEDKPLERMEGELVSMGEAKYSLISELFCAQRLCNCKLLQFAQDAVL